jgi:hypothetical protein
MGKQSRRLSRRSRSEQTVPMTPEVEKAIEDQIQFFRDKFGREPGPDDPLFFDPDADTPQLINDEKILKGIIEAMVPAGLDPPFIYAYQKLDYSLLKIIGIAYPLKIRLHGVRLLPNERTAASISHFRLAQANSYWGVFSKLAQFTV